MKSTALLVILLLCASCSGVAREARELLAQADAKMSAEDYSGATALYAEFATANPDHAHAARARATHKALDRMLSYQAEMTRAQRGGETARAEADRLRGEVAKLRADLERLRNIDLQPLRPK